MLCSNDQIGKAMGHVAVSVAMSVEAINKAVKPGNGVRRDLATIK